MNPLLLTALVTFLGLFILLLIIVFTRTICFVPPKKERQKVSVIAVDTERAAHALSEMIKCRTVSYIDKSLEDEEEFSKFEKLLPNLFPKVFQKCTFSKVGPRALLIKWAGRTDDSPTVLMAHYDVVNAREDEWDRPPFSGMIDNGVIWGRGTLDTKGSLNGILQAAEMLIEDGYVPERDIYFAFGGDEEVNGTGAKDIVDLFAERGIVPGLVLDEGGAVVTKIVPGVSASAAIIGIAEKGMANIKYTVNDSGGHSSSPAAITPIDRLSRACTRMHAHPFKYNMTTSVAQFLDTTCRHSTFIYRLLFSNLWLFAPVLNMAAKRMGGEINAILRTTTAFTQMSGSDAANVMPSSAYMVSNHRIAHGESVESLRKRIVKIVRDPKIEVTVLDGDEPSRVSDTQCLAWRTVTDTVSEVWQDAIVSPYCMLACSDAKNWGVLSDRVYRFSPMSLSAEERGSIHGKNERIPFSTVTKTVEFYVRLMKKI